MTIDDRVIRQIKAEYNKLEREEKLLPPDKLDEYRDRFRELFGPERLAGLDGETLLNTMHLHGNKDSLVYWLEFKNDEEFSNRLFGGIGGGTASNSVSSAARRRVSGSPAVHSISRT